MKMETNVSKMRELSSTDFDARGIDRTPQSEYGFSEKKWFECGQLLGMIVLTPDAEWACVVLAKHEGRGFAPIDARAFFPMAAEAIDALRSMFEKHVGVGVVPNDRKFQGWGRAAFMCLHHSDGRGRA